MGSIFKINISKGFLENKVEPLAIYKLIMSMYMKRYFEERRLLKGLNQRRIDYILEVISKDFRGIVKEKFLLK